jgi:iron complex transport system ATP-binding protein
MTKNKQHIVLQTKNLSIGYSNKQEVNFIAKNLSFALEKGKLICLLGRNGIGKSTLLRTLSKTQNTLSGDILIDGERLSKEDLIRIDKAIELVDIKDICDKKNHALSDGQLQKVMIARALAQDTDIIILDEPTAHLDLHHKIEVFKTLQHLVHKTDKTIILSTHEVNLALQLADELWLMTENKFTTGTIENLIKSKELETIFPENQIVFNPGLKQFTLKK